MIYQHIAMIRPRLAMYIGSESIRDLERYLRGYERAITDHGIVYPDAPPFCHFLPWFSARIGQIGALGWADVLLERADDDEPKALRLFFDFAEEFGGLRPRIAETLALPEGHRRSAQYREWNGNDDPIPTHIELVVLEPGRWWYVRHRYGRHVQEQHHSILHPERSEALWSITWEFDIRPELWDQLAVAGPGADEPAS